MNPKKKVENGEQGTGAKNSGFEKSEKNIRQIESGVRLPSLKLFVDICNALQVSPEYLLSQELEMFEQMENADEMHKNVINKIKRLTPKELNILHSLLESYFISLESIKEQR